MTGSSALLWALGLVGIVFAILNFFVGIFEAHFDLFWIGANLAVGLALLIAAAAVNFDALRERMRSGEARRAGKYGSSAIVGTALLLAILAMLGFLGSRYHHRFDWSEQKVHSLSSQTLETLEGLGQDLDVLALYPPLDMGPVRELLDRYAYASPRFRVQYADPNERPELLERHGITPQDLGQGLVRVALGEESVQVSEVTENALTNAIVKLTRTGEKKVYFVEGHGERPVEQAGDAPGPQAYSRAAEALRNENYRVEKLLLAARGEVPEDADVVVVGGPTRPLLDVEHAALRRWVASGGALLVLVDPRANTDLLPSLRDWGADVGDDVVVDRALALFGRATSPFAARYDSAHPITAQMRETSLFQMARSVRAAEGADLTPLVFTGEDSWAERDLERFFEEGTAEFDGEDLPGPVPLAVAGTPRTVADPDAGRQDEGEAAGPDAAGAGEGDAAPARLVVFGDVDFASNEFLEAYSNRDLFVNSVNWLMGDVEAISVRPRLSRASRFQLSSAQFMRIRSMSLFVLPEAIAIVGVVVWWSRRRTPER